MKRNMWEKTGIYYLTAAPAPRPSLSASGRAGGNMKDESFSLGTTREARLLGKKRKKKERKRIPFSRFLSSSQVVPAVRNDFLFHIRPGRYAQTRRRAAGPAGRLVDNNIFPFPCRLFILLFLFLLPYDFTSFPTSLLSSREIIFLSLRLSFGAREIRKRNFLERKKARMNEKRSESEGKGSMKK